MLFLLFCVSARTRGKVAKENPWFPEHGPNYYFDIKSSKRNIFPELVQACYPSLIVRAKEEGEQGAVVIISPTALANSVR